MRTNIYVLAKNGTPLMPIHSYRRAKKLLREHKARVICMRPYTLRLKYSIESPVTEPCIVKVDPGRTNIGICVTDTQGRPLFCADVETRNKDVPKLMAERARHRRMSRSGERKARQRLASKYQDLKTTEVWRKLPGCKNAVRCKVIKNTESKFTNRTRPEGWLTPTANQLLQTHVNLVKLVQKILPISSAIIELNRFAFMKMDDPSVSGTKYQDGRMKGYGSVEQYVNSLQAGHCLFCKNKIDHYHHIIEKSNGGSNTPENIAGLCERHHGLVHTQQKWADRLDDVKYGTKKKYAALSIINQIMPSLIKAVSVIMPVSITSGFNTKETREWYKLSKSEYHCGHYIDAWCFGISPSDGVKLPVFGEVYRIKQYRRHNRQIVMKQSERTYYLNGTAVCKNRKKRTGQKDDSLTEWRFKNQNKVHLLTVKKSVRSYNDVKRKLPGAIFICKGKRYIMRGSDNKGARFYAEGLDNSHRFPKAKCQWERWNKGLVFL